MRFVTRNGGGAFAFQEPPETTRLNQAIFNQVDSALQGSREFKAALERYRAITREAAERTAPGQNGEKARPNGLTIVVAAGNDAQTARFAGIRNASGSGYNWYAMSDHVISVGASENNNTPGDLRDDTIWSSSSPGNDRWQPLVVAQGTRLPTALSERREIQGTSFSAPLVSGTIGLMLEQNRDLTFAKIREILRKSTTAIDGVPVNQQGAGVLNVTQAVLAARR